MIGRIGAWCAAHWRLVVVFWALVFGILGLALAPRAEHELAGAGWEDSGAESVAARTAIEKSFPGFGSYSLAVVVDAGKRGLEDPKVARTMDEVNATLDAEPAVSRVVEPSRGGGISPDGRWRCSPPAPAATRMRWWTPPGGSATSWRRSPRTG